MRDAAGWSVVKGNYVVYAVRDGNVAGMRFGKVRNFTEDQMTIIGTGWRGSVNTRESRLSHPMRVLIINEDQVPSKVLPGLKSWPSKVTSNV